MNYILSALFLIKKKEKKEEKKKREDFHNVSEGSYLS